MISERAHAECVRLLDLLTNKRVQESWSWVFMTPVSGIPGYEDVVKKPMDLGTVKRHLGAKPSRCRFRSHDKFARDVRLVFHNAMLYNKDDRHVKGSVFDAAQHLLRVFETAYAKAIDTVFKDERADAADDPEPDGPAPSASASSAAAAVGASKSDSRAAEAVAGDASASAATSSASASASSSSRHHHHHHRHHRRHESDASGDEGGDGGGASHKRHKKEKKEKKAKKSKKKSKDKDRDRERGDKEKKHATSSSGASSSDKKLKPHKSSSSSRDKDRERSKDKHHHHHSSSSSGASVSSSAASSLVKKQDAPVATVPSVSPAAPTTSSSAIGGKMADSDIQACLGVLMKLIKYKEGAISPAAPFLQPVELSHFPDYRVKVPTRMHLYGVQKKLRSGGYADLRAFAFDVRLVFSNCLIYNSDVVLSKVMRSHAVTLMKLFETLFEKVGGRWPGVPERWKCHQILHEILAHRTDGQETAQWFKYPIQTYFDSPDQIPYGYYKKIRVPMDLSTVSARLHLGEYAHAAEFIKDVKLIFDNCIRYWKPDPQGQTYCESAKTLTALLKAQVDHVFGGALSDELHAKGDKHKSSSTPSSSKAHRPSSASSTPAATATATAIATTDDKGGKRKSSSSSSSSKSAAERDVCLGILKQLRAHKMKGYRGVDIPTAGPFLHAVDTTKYPDYLKIISEPMDFAKIERKLKGDRYGSVDEFSADVHLIFSNCHKYNSDPVEGADIRAMASSLRDYFVELYTARFGVADGASGSSGGSKALLDAKPPTLSHVAPGKAVAPAESRGATVLPLAKHEPSAEPSKAKTPARSPTKKTPSDAAKLQPAPTSASVVAIKSESTLAPVTAVAVAVAPHAVVPTTTTTAKVKSEPSGGALVSEADELRRRQERKERKERKKEKKEKKKKKEKEKKRKEHRKEKSESSSSSAVNASAVASVTAVSATPKRSPVAAPLSVPSTSPPPPPLKSATGSKVSPSEPQRAASTASSKKSSGGGSSSSKKSSGSSSTSASKKSDLSAWEAACDRVLNRLGKIEQVAKLHFDQPLLEVFPQLHAEYSRLIREPMDLRTLREQLHAHALASPAAFQRQGRLIFQNAIAFNCASDPASQHVRDMSSHLQWYLDSLCAELVPVVAPDASSNSSNPSPAGGDAKARQRQLRRERAELVAGVPMELKPKECLKLLRVLNAQKYDKNCWPFRKPAKVLFPALAPEYFAVVATPMDLQTVGEKVAALEYKVHGEFIRDVRLTFENAIAYNKADKGRDGWSVYAAAVHMLGVAEDLWGDVTLEVTERLRRKDLLRRERERLGEKRRPASGDRKERARTSGSGNDAKLSAASTSVASGTLVIPFKVADKGDRAVSSAAGTGAAAGASVLAAATVVTTAVAGASAVSRDGSPDLSATRLKLSIVNRSSAAPSGSGSGAGAPSAASAASVDRMNKSERKAEEKRRKRARREEEIARSEKRRRTAVAATDDALREAEERSRRKLQKLEVAQAMRAREERELKARAAEAERARVARMRFDAQAWTGVLVPAQPRIGGFWSHKRVKLQLPAAFAGAGAGVGVAEPIGSH
ncbi:hypothetical protein PybrP1_007837 [[Pythium] brassicae (nom. inval.)]|nr:hypothetical protein PybrP1_007837 [[Pythium] brassicae (nom. inval.)]